MDIIQHSHTIPIAQGMPVIGNLLDMIYRPIDFLSEQHRKLGSVFKVNVGTKTYTVLAGSEANLLLTGNHRDSFSSRKTWGQFVDKMDCPHLLIGTDGEAHTYQRKLLKPFFAKHNFKDRYTCLRDIVQQRLDSVLDQTIKVGPFVRNLVCQQSAMILQNMSVSTQQSETFMFAQNTVLNVYMTGKWPRLALLNPKYIYSQWKTNAFSKALLANHQPESAVETYMDKVAQGKREHPEWFTEGDIHAHTMMPFTGGVDPAGGAMSFLLYELLRQPAIAQRVRDEVDYFCRQGFPSYEDLDEMVDLQGFIYEVLRLHPTGFALSRSASQDIPFGGYLIPKGSELLIFSTAGHFNEAYFPDPLAFDIERYRAPRQEHKARGAFAPFGRGPHACVGNALAELQLQINAIVMLHDYNIELRTPLDKLKAEYLPGPFMSKNFKVRFARRGV
jgi:cytochrome P450